MSRALFYYFGLGSPPGASSGIFVSNSVPTPTVRTRLGGLYDQLLDPMTLDFIDTPDGEWEETADSRTIVLIMLEMRLGRSYSAPNDGTRIHELLEDGEPVTVSTVEAECRRAMGILQNAGDITDFSMVSTDDDGNPRVDNRGRFSPELRYTDLASGSPVDTSVALGP